MKTAEAAAFDPREIPGPSALGQDRGVFLRLLWFTAFTDFKLRFHGAVLGYLWSLGRPLLLFGMIYVVFSEILRFGDRIDNFPVFLLLNIMLVQFFIEATNGSLRSLVAREQLVRKTQCPRLIMPLSVVLTSGIGLAFSLVAVFAYIILYGVTPMWTWLLLPVLVTLLLMFTTGMALLLSALYVRFRDIDQIWGVISFGIFYLSAVFYPLDAVPEHIRDLVVANPLVPILTMARDWITDPNAPDLITAAGGWQPLIPAALVFVGVCGLGIWLFRRTAPAAAEQL